MSAKLLKVLVGLVQTSLVSRAAARGHTVLRDISLCAEQSSLELWVYPVPHGVQQQAAICKRLRTRQAVWQMWS